MKILSIEEISKAISAVCLITMTLLLLFFCNTFISNQNVEVKIQKETHIANLIGQYNSDLNYCLDLIRTTKGLTQEDCIKEMNESELAKLITSWGQQSVLMKAEKLK